MCGFVYFGKVCVFDCLVCGVDVEDDEGIDLLLDFVVYLFVGVEVVFMVGWFYFVGDVIFLVWGIEFGDFFCVWFVGEDVFLDSFDVGV